MTAKRNEEEAARAEPVDLEEASPESREEKLAGQEDESDEKESNEERETESKKGGKPLPQNAVTRLYDKIPLTFKQVDIIAKVIVGVTVLILIIALVTSPGPKS